MSSINKKNPIFTHEGGRAKPISPEQQLRRSVLACMLWEDQFYEDGESIASRITECCSQVQPAFISQLAIEARTKYKLRHVPLLLLRELAKHGRGKMVGDTIYEVIQRADELSEFLAIYWKDGKCPLSSQVKKGLARAFTKFDAYQLAKYNRGGNIKLRDVLFLCHAKPKDRVQEQHWKHLVNGTLSAPDTWEVSLSAGADKAETFERLLAEHKLGYMAILRNLRNMEQSGVNRDIVKNRLLTGAKNSKALPFRFIAAMLACPKWEDMIEAAMLVSCENLEKLPGKTAIVVDCSGSMGAPLSNKSQLSRFQAAAALAILVREIADEPAVYAFGTDVKQVRPRRGMALGDELLNSGVGHGTRLGNAVACVNADGYDRAIIITDEQSRDSVPNPIGGGYVINVASYQNGIGYGPWNHIDGFSEAVIDWIREIEFGR